MSEPTMCDKKKPLVVGEDIDMPLMVGAEGNGAGKGCRLESFEDVLESVGVSGRWNILSFLTCAGGETQCIVNQWYNKYYFTE